MSDVFDGDLMCMLHECFDFGFRYFKSFLILNQSFKVGPSNVGYDTTKGIDLPSNNCKGLYKWDVFSGLFYEGGGGKSIMVVGKFYELYDIWQGWC